LTKAYADLFIRKGGRFIKGDARSLGSEPSGWNVITEAGLIATREAVVALGPWSDDIFRPLGYNIPLAVKPGYHMHGRSFQAKHRATRTRADQGNQLLKAGTFDQSGSGATEIIIDHGDGGESDRSRRLDQCVLPPLALSMFGDLPRGRLADIDPSARPQMIRRDLLLAESLEEQLGERGQQSVWRRFRRHGRVAALEIENELIARVTSHLNPPSSSRGSMIGQTAAQ